MFSMTFKTTAILLAASTLHSAHAQDYSRQPIQQASAAGAPTQQPGQSYPQLQAPLYPSPVQHTPHWNGGTIITNQAFAPHEMLYPHTYRAVFPPYYYKVKGGWIWTPFGMRQHEEVKLQGTEVTVKYRSHIPLFSGFKAPRSDQSLINCGPRLY